MRCGARLLKLWSLVLGVKTYFPNNTKTSLPLHHVDIYIDGAKAVMSRTSCTLTQRKTLAMGLKFGFVFFFKAPFT